MSTRARIIRRIVVLVLLVVAGLFFSLGYVKQCSRVEKPPTAIDAPWLIQTSSRIYYAREYSIRQGTPSVKGYWVFDGRNYKFMDGVLEFKESIYGKVTVIRRVNQ